MLIIFFRFIQRYKVHDVYSLPFCGMLRKDYSRNSHMGYRAAQPHGVSGGTATWGYRAAQPHGVSGGTATWGYQAAQPHGVSGGTATWGIGRHPNKILMHGCSFSSVLYF